MPPLPLHVCLALLWSLFAASASSVNPSGPSPRFDACLSLPCQSVLAQQLHGCSRMNNITYSLVQKPHDERPWQSPDTVGSAPRCLRSFSAVIDGLSTQSVRCAILWRMLPAPSFFSLPAGASTGATAFIGFSADRWSVYNQRLAATLPATRAFAAAPSASGVARSQPPPDSRAASRASRLAFSAQGNGAQAMKPLEAVIIVDHGSRRDESNRMLYEFVDIYRCGCHHAAACNRSWRAPYSCSGTVSWPCCACSRLLIAGLGYVERRHRELMTVSKTMPCSCRLAAPDHPHARRGKHNPSFCGASVLSSSQASSHPLCRHPGESAAGRWWRSRTWSWRRPAWRTRWTPPSPPARRSSPSRRTSCPGARSGQSSG